MFDTTGVIIIEPPLIVYVAAPETKNVKDPPAQTLPLVIETTGAGITLTLVLAVPVQPFDPVTAA